MKRTKALLEAKMTQLNQLKEASVQLKKQCAAFRTVTVAVNGKSTD